MLAQMKSMPTYVFPAVDGAAGAERNDEGLGLWHTSRYLVVSGKSIFRLAVRAKGLGSKLLREVATIVTPETLLAWHRQLIAQKHEAVPNGDAADRENRRRSRVWCS
jgi:hypothetical protein